MFDGKPILLLACGALAREIKEVQRLGGWEHVVLECLPAQLHNTPKKIPGAVRARLEEARDQYSKVFVGYADCGTGGQLDAVLDEYGAERIPGAHCYEFFAGSRPFAEFSEAELGTFYLTDFLVRHFESLVYRGLGLDRHPELLPMYFGNYKRLLYLAQTESEELQTLAREYAQRLGLEYHHHFTGLAPFEQALAGAH
jgi:hypothetical protein